MNRILLTGATGFLGREIFKKLNSEDVITLGRSSTNKIVCDLSVACPELPADIDVVIHCAGLAHETGRQSSDDVYRLSHEQGLLNLLRALDQTNVKNFIFVSSVAVYGVDHGLDYDESYSGQPTTAYGRYKLAAEQQLVQWAQFRNKNFCIIRPPLIFGDNPPGNLGQLIRAIKKNRYLFIQDVSPRKSMVDINELSLFIAHHALIMQPEHNGIYNVTDGVSPDLHTLSDYLIKKYNPGFIRLTLPGWIINLAAKLGDLIPGFPINSKRLSKLSLSLTFSDQKAREKIGWKGTSVLKN